MKYLLKYWRKVLGLGFFLFRFVCFLITEEYYLLENLSLLWSGNGQLATDSHIAGKLNRWNTPCSVTISLLEETRGNTVIGKQEIWELPHS